MNVHIWYLCWQNSSHVGSVVVLFSFDHRNDTTSGFLMAFDTLSDFGFAFDVVGFFVVFATLFVVDFDVGFDLAFDDGFVDGLDFVFPFESPDVGSS